MMILILGILSEEQQALVEKIFRDHHVFFQRVSYRIVRSEDAANDAVSAAYLKIMDNIEKISELPCPQMTAFCVMVVKNASYDLLRQSNKIVPIGLAEDIPQEKSPSAEEQHIRNAEAQRLSELIDMLPSEDRCLIHLRFALEMSYKEIGMLLGISEEAAKKRGQRIVKRLKSMHEGE